MKPSDLPELRDLMRQQDDEYDKVLYHDGGRYNSRLIGDNGRVPCLICGKNTRFVIEVHESCVEWQHRSSRKGPVRHWTKDYL